MRNSGSIREIATTKEKKSKVGSRVTSRMAEQAVAVWKHHETIQRKWYWIACCKL
jgi:hypothetical protein